MREMLRGVAAKRRQRSIPGGIENHPATPLKIRAAHWAGTLIRVSRRPVLALGRSLPGLAGAAAVSVGIGQAAGRIFGHGLSLWVALVVAGVFLVRIGAEINASPPAPRQQDPDA